MQSPSIQRLFASKHSVSVSASAAYRHITSESGEQQRERSWGNGRGSCIWTAVLLLSGLTSLRLEHGLRRQQSVPSCSLRRPRGKWREIGHEEVMKQRRDLSVELGTLREELASSVHSCERLVQEKDELRASFDEVLRKLREQQQLDLVELEERLKSFYSSEWEKVHLAYQKETDMCKGQMQEQLEQLQSKHESLKKELENSHSKEVECLKQQFDESFKELKQCHEKQMKTFNTALKESKEILSEQVQELMMENSSLKEKLSAEVKRRMLLAEKSQVL
ncbi:hypothetical protein DNTS_035179 [Danionella cerebrum]|uniref:Uncharacterized protein n=1 Tax=Danionella cerebrum TaxID=2873325 RepID=A0A553R2H8_9TELE|nr:hypothetical protein DNTS_035179 [Danionella translucida]